MNKFLRLILVSSFMAINCLANDPSWAISVPSDVAKVLSDLEWMQTLYADLEKQDRKLNEVERKRISNIYKKQSGAEKGYAGMILVSYLPVENYEIVLRELLFSSNKDELTAAVEMLNFKLSSGTRSEKKYLFDQGDFESRLKEIKNLQIFENYRLRQVERLVERFEFERGPATQSISQADKSMASSPVFTQSSLPKPEVKEPAEVRSVEVVEETPEQSSQWWLWLVGTLVIFGGLGWILCHKR